MSWLKWNGEEWSPTHDEAVLDLHLQAPDTGGKRFTWTFHLHHIDPVPDENRSPKYRHLSVEISDLGFADDWRKFSGFELRSSPAWQEEHEHFGEYGNLFVPHISVHGAPYEKEGDEKYDGFWTGDYFIFKLGQRDGLTFACELDGWLEPNPRYERLKPESPAELAQVPACGPNLRVLTRTRIEKISVNMARCGDDPVPLARRYVKEFTGLTDLKEKSIDWWGVELPNQPRPTTPGWRSTVKFEAQT